MNSYVTIFGILLVGFVVYFFIRDQIFHIGSTQQLLSNESFTAPDYGTPAPASIEIRQAPIYPERTVAPSGPQAPAQEAPQGEVVMHRDPKPTDPYYEQHDSSDIPENLRYPERSFRAPPLNDQTGLAVQAGIASKKVQMSSDNPQQFQEEMIQGGGEFMPGIFANDTYNDNSYSTF